MDNKYFDIENGVLNIDLDTPYDKEANKIDVYTFIGWTAENKEDYQAKEQIINDYQVDNNLFTLFAWCDISGFDYWVIQQNEDNYVSIDVVLKKPANQYTQAECSLIVEAIEKADSELNYQLC